MERPDAVPRGTVAVMFLDLLREADGPLSVRALKRLWDQRAPRTGEPGVDAVWRRVQPVLRRHPQVVFDPVRGTYRFQAQPAAGPPSELGVDEALDRLLPARMSQRQAALAAVVRAGLAALAATARDAVADRDELESRLRAGYADQRALRAAQERAIRLAAVRTLVDVVSEVDELAAAGVPTPVLVERVRVLAHAFGLHAIGRAGDHTTFAAAWHSPIGSRPPDDSRVVIIRPGYSWRDGDEVVLIARAQVAAVTVHKGGSA